MPPTDAANVVTQAASDGGWTAGLLAILVLLLAGLVTFHYRAMWSHIQRMSLESQDVVDDNTLGWLQVARIFNNRPCLNDSDADKLLTKTAVKPEDFGDQAEHVRRVLDRREKRRVSREAK
jgi:hypothetical protein